jgi:hypothetical protein
MVVGATVTAVAVVYCVAARIEYMIAVTAAIRRMRVRLNFPRACITDTSTIHKCAYCSEISK